MIFNRRPEIAGKHAFLSPSNYHWLNYDEHKLEARFISATAAARGTALHDLAHSAIELGVRLPDDEKTLNMYVNDGIGYKMDVEVPFYYSPNCFGHADTACFRSNTLRVHDLKTGLVTASMKQLQVYNAIFCLEYGISPFDFEAELRIYQNDQVFVEVPHPDTILHIMDKIVTFDRQIEMMKGAM